MEASSRDPYVYMPFDYLDILRYPLDHHIPNSNVTPKRILMRLCQVIGPRNWKDWRDIRMLLYTPSPTRKSRYNDLSFFVSGTLLYVISRFIFTNFQSILNKKLVITFGGIQCGVMQAIMTLVPCTN